MNKLVLPLAALLLVALTMSTPPALAGEKDLCRAGPREQWRPMAELEQQLGARGWRIDKIEVDDGCYEVEAYDKEGWKVEAHFHPKTLARLQRGRDGYR